jgi:hypothetical protein
MAIGDDDVMQAAEDGAPVMLAEIAMRRALNLEEPDC